MHNFSHRPPFSSVIDKKSFTIFSQTKKYVNGVKRVFFAC
ncbi:Uncharacterized protein dnm_075030 [Desulfonema magnum]|uniref:Uncharacterized protein n=1 Tax=Desulfonema magnum TaxID=45655 RepID=A0A975GRU3_9BACT|nr:Uncharacterized protein dnm_075030 [Desulfonema magnum]